MGDRQVRAGNSAREMCSMAEDRGGFSRQLSHTRSIRQLGKGVGFVDDGRDVTTRNRQREWQERKVGAKLFDVRLISKL